MHLSSSSPRGEGGPRAVCGGIGDFGGPCSISVPLWWRNEGPLICCTPNHGEIE